MFLPAFSIVENARQLLIIQIFDNFQIRYEIFTKSEILFTEFKHINQFWILF